MTQLMKYGDQLLQMEQLKNVPAKDSQMSKVGGHHEN
jgi:hypothetical protein